MLSLVVPRFQVSGDALSEVEVFQVIALSPSLALSPFRPFAWGELKLKNT